MSSTTPRRSDSVDTDYGSRPGDLMPDVHAFRDPPSSSRDKRVVTGSILMACGLACATAWSADPAPARSAISDAAGACAPASGHSFLCGADRPEDLARIPGTRWLVFSGFTDGAGLKLVDTRARTLRPWYTGDAAQIEPDRSRYGGCPAAPDPTRFNTQGLSLRSVGSTQHILYVANHGGRESIEIFRIDVGGDEPSLHWIGCVLMPAATPANSVATYSDGTILASVLTRPGTSITDFVRGQTTGGVYDGVRATRVSVFCQGRNCRVTTVSRPGGTIRSFTSLLLDGTPLSCTRGSTRHARCGK